jgi:transaldolase
MYVEALAAPDTINTIPDKTLLAFADHGKVGGVMPVEGGDAEETIAKFRDIGVDDMALAEQLQEEGIASFNKSWEEMMECLASKSGRFMRQAHLAVGR